MAFAVYQLPENIFNLSRSPIIVSAGDSAVSDENYRVVIKVYAWQGNLSPIPSDPLVTLDKVQDSDGRAKFNIAPIIEDIFVPNDPTIKGTTFNNGEGIVVNLYMDIGWTNEGAFNSDTTTDIFECTAGYSIYPDDINSFDDFSLYENSSLALTVRPRDGVIITDQPAWFNVFWQGNTIALADRTAFSGSASSTFVNFSDGGGTAFPTTSNNFIVRQRIDSTYVFDTLALGAGTATARIDAASADTFTMDYTDALCDVGADTIAFINRFGVWDWLHCYAVQRTGIKTERIEYTSRVSEFNGSGEVTYDRYNPSRKVLRAKGTTTYEVNTGWITEDHNPLIQDMMLSKIWYSFNLTVAIILVDKEVQFKRDGDVDLINYTFRFEVANNAIQDIQ